MIGTQHCRRGPNTQVALPLVAPVAALAILLTQLVHVNSSIDEPPTFVRRPGC